MRVNILTPGFTTPNGRAFLFPFLKHRRALREAGIEFRLFDAPGPGLTDCDRLLVDRKFQEPMWPTREAEILDTFADWSRQVPVVFCDTSDSAGWLIVKLLPLVHAYAKGQLLSDRAGYLEPHYGYREFADYYHRTHGIVDDSPEWSSPVPDPDLLGKLRASWNTGLADYSLAGPFRMALFGRLGWQALLRFPRNFHPAEAPRTVPVSCRFGTAYARATVAAQRKLVRERMADRMPVGKISRRRYIAELQRARVVVSPFGWGEITLKDFEVFLTGGLLFKPDMSNIETWPDLFVDDETCVFHRWDLSDFDERLDALLADEPRRREIAAAGQERYRAHLVGSDAADLFVTRLRTVVA
jgi:hypothetical protein